MSDKATLVLTFVAVLLTLGVASDFKNNYSKGIALGLVTWSLLIAAVYTDKIEYQAMFGTFVVMCSLYNVFSAMPSVGSNATVKAKDIILGFFAPVLALAFVTTKSFK